MFEGIRNPSFDECKGELCGLRCSTLAALWEENMRRRNARGRIAFGLDPVGICGVLEILVD
jgi:hypothetical protein